MEFKIHCIACRTNISHHWCIAFKTLIGSWNTLLWSLWIVHRRNINVHRYMPMYVGIISPFLIWCCKRFLVTFIWLSFFVKFRLPSNAPTTARPLGGMICSFVNLTIMLLFSSLIWRLWLKIFFSRNHWFTGLLYHDMASPYRWIVIKYKTFNKPLLFA